MILLFNLQETELLIPAEQFREFCEENNLTEAEFTAVSRSGYRGRIVAYPLPWAQSFGSEFYQYTQNSPSSGIDNHDLWNVTIQGSPYYGKEPQPRPKEHIAQNIRQLLEGLRKEE